MHTLHQVQVAGHRDNINVFAKSWLTRDILTHVFVLVVLQTCDSFNQSEALLQYQPPCAIGCID